MAEKATYNQAQGYLLTNSRKLIRRAARDRYKTDAQVVQNPAWGFPPQYVKKVVKKDSQDDFDTLSDLMNAFTTPSKLEFVTDIPDDVRTKLRPTYKIYKSIMMNNGNRVDMHLRSSTTAGSYKNILIPGSTSNVKTPQVVVKNIEITRLGGNLAEINNNIEVTITLYATKLDYFFEKQKPPAIKNGTFELTDRVAKIVNNGVSWIDLIKLNLQDPDEIRRTQQFNKKSRSGRETKEQILGDFPIPYVFSEPDQRIKLEIGYGEIGAELPGYSAEQILKMQRLVNAQKEVISLSLQSNNVSFNEDGTANLQVTFRGSQGTNITNRTMDLMYDPFIDDLLLQIDDQTHLLSLYANELEDNEAHPFDSNEVKEAYKVFNSHYAFNSMNLSRRFFLTLLEEGVPVGSSRKAFPKSVERGTFAERQIVLQGRAEVLALIEKSINQRTEAKSKIKQYQAGLLFRGLYGPALALLNEYAPFLDGLGSGDSNDKARNKATAERVKRYADPGDRKSRVYIAQPKYSDVVHNKRMSEANVFVSAINFFDYLLKNADNTDLIESYGNKIEGAGQTNAQTPLTGLGTEEDPTISAASANSNVKVKYVFFGDILEVALEVVASNNRLGQSGMTTEGTLGTKELLKRLHRPSLYTIHNNNRVGQADNRANMAAGVYSQDPNREEGNLDVAGSYVVPLYSKKGIIPRQQRDLYNKKEKTDARAIEHYRNHEDVENNQRIKQLYTLVGEILTSQVAYADPADPTSKKKINVADVPISLDLFRAWFSSTILNRNSLFLRDYINLLLTFLMDILSTQYDASVTHEVEPPELLINRTDIASKYYNFFTTNRIVGHKNNNEKQYIPTNGIKIERLRSFAATVEKMRSNSIYAKALTIISQSPEVDKVLPEKTDRRVRDKENNVPHIIFGDATNGILQSLSFSKLDMKGAREARLLQGEKLYYNEDYNGPNLLTERYNANLELVGTTFFKPSMQFYLDPKPLELGYSKSVSSPARLLGLGGYYSVIRVVHELNFSGAATWSTTLEGHWVSFGDDYSDIQSKAKIGKLKLRSFVGRLAKIDVKEGRHLRRGLSGRLYDKDPFKP